MKPCSPLTEIPLRFYSLVSGSPPVLTTLVEPARTQAVLDSKGSAEPTGQRRCQQPRPIFHDKNRSSD
jgi:hypothetical protein